MCIAYFLTTLGCGYSSVTYAESSSKVSMPRGVTHVIKAKDNSELIELSQTPKNHWSLGERICFNRGEKKLCGEVVLTTDTTATVKVDNKPTGYGEVKKTSAPQGVSKPGNNPQNYKTTEIPMLEETSGLADEPGSHDRKELRRTEGSTPNRAIRSIETSISERSADRRDSSRDRWQLVSFAVNALVAVQSKDAYSSWPELAWTPEVSLSPNFTVKALLGVSGLKGEGGSNYALLEYELMLGLYANALGIEAGGGLQTWVGQSNTLPLVSGNLVWRRVTRDNIAWFERVFVGYSACFYSPYMTHEIKAGVGFVF